MLKKAILVGDKTTTQGVVLSGSSSSFCGDTPVARKGDSVFCPQCQQTGTILEGSHNYFDGDLPVALEGHLVSCGCPLGTNKLIASQSSLWGE